MDTLTFQNQSLKDKAKRFEEALRRSTDEQIVVSSNPSFDNGGCLRSFPTESSSVSILLTCFGSCSPQQEALAPYQHIEQDLKSLKEVVEMKNQQIHQQEKKITDLEKVVGSNKLVQEAHMHRQMQDVSLLVCFCSSTPSCAQ